jgi:hypothetical protein
MRRAIHAAILALAFAAALSTVPVVAQQVDDNALQAARELVTVTRATDQVQQMLPNMIQTIKPLIVQGRPEVEKDFDALVPTCSTARTHESAKWQSRWRRFTPTTSPPTTYGS